METEILNSPNLPTPEAIAPGIKSGQDGDPHVWCMYNGEKQDGLVSSLKALKPKP